MKRPLNENMTGVRIETDEGDLLPVMDVAGSKLCELVDAVSKTQKQGTLTLKISVKPSTAGAMAIKADVTINKPKGMPAESLLWATPEGNLIAEDPRQNKLDLKPVKPAEVRELKSISV